MSKKFSAALVFLGILGLGVFFFFRDSVILGNCSGDSLDCRKLGQYADYLWPLWDFSRAILVIGVLSLCVQKNKIVFAWSLLALVGISIAVSIAPSTSSDFLLPSEKKSIGTFLSGVYFVISLGMIGVQFFKQRRTPQS